MNCAKLNFSDDFFLYKIYFFLTHIVREQCGHTLKSSLRHILSVDRRDNPVFPTEGSLFKLVQEYAGIGKGQFIKQFHEIFVHKFFKLVYLFFYDKHFFREITQQHKYH